MCEDEGGEGGVCTTESHSLLSFYKSWCVEMERKAAGGRRVPKGGWRFIARSQVLPPGLELIGARLTFQWDGVTPGAPSHPRISVVGRSRGTSPEWLFGPGLCGCTDATGPGRNSTQEGWGLCEDVRRWNMEEQAFTSQRIRLEFATYSWIV